jgi:short-subunit dehydrogenase
MAPTVVITGASAGVGRAVAVEFARQGFDVALLARGTERLESAAREARILGVNALPITVDVADYNAVDAAAARVQNELGPIEVWVNNAMATVFAPVHDIAPEEFHRITAVTYLGQVHGTMAALERMRRRNRGTIVQVGSALSYRAIPLQSAYCGAKFAVRGFTDSLRTELAHEGSRIRITMVQLPAVNTPQFDWARSRMPRKLQPLPPIFQPEAIARDIVRATREAPRELWIGRSSLKAIIGTMLLPLLGDRIVSTEAWDGQMTNERDDGSRYDNLFAPPPGDPGAHGRFDHRAESDAIGVYPSWLRVGAMCAVVALIAGAFAAGRSRNGRAVARVPVRRRLR